MNSPGAQRMPEPPKRTLPRYCSHGEDIPYFGVLKRSDVDNHASTHYQCPDCVEDDCCPMVYHYCKATGGHGRTSGPPAKRMLWV